MQKKVENIINIYSVNDFHGVVETICWSKEKKESLYDNPGVVMFSKLLSLQENSQESNIIVSAGDMFESPSLGLGGPGKITIPLMNLVKCTAMTVGNHEFDWKPMHLNYFHEIQTKMDFPLLSCNLYEGKSGERASFAKPSTIINVAGFKLALIGVTTQECHTLCLENELGSIEVKDPLICLKQEIDKVKENGAEIIIIVAHTGIIEDQINGELTGELVNLINNFSCDVIQGVISAHSHQLLSGRLKGIPIVQGGAYGQGIGHLKIILDDEKRKVHCVNPEVINIDNTVCREKINPKVKEVIDSHLNVQSNPLVKIGYTTICLEVNKHKETYWGKFVAKVICDKAGADIGLINQGAFRSSIKAGVIYNVDIIQSIPFDNTIYSMDLKGDSIKHLIEKSITLHRGILQTNGLTYDILKNNDGESKIENIRLESGMLLDLEKSYRVATSNFLAGGGDFFTEFQEGVERQDTGIIIRDAVINTVLNQHIIGI